MSIPTAVFRDKRSRKTAIVTRIIWLLVGIAGIAPAQFTTIAVALFAGWPYNPIWVIGVDRNTDRLAEFLRNRAIRALPETVVDPAFLHQ